MCYTWVSDNQRGNTCKHQGGQMPSPGSVEDDYTNRETHAGALENQWSEKVQE